jgi:hypothetical protein
VILVLQKLGIPAQVPCLRCAASAIALSMVSTPVVERPGFRGERVYEFSSRGPLFAYLTSYPALFPGGAARR